MYCPRCHAEYREGFTECSDCGVPLVAELQPESHSMDAVTVFETRDSFALRLAKATLEDAGIEYLVIGEPLGELPGISGVAGIGETPLWNRAARIQVLSEFAGEARDLLAPLEHPE